MSRSKLLLLALIPCLTVACQDDTSGPSVSDLEAVITTSSQEVRMTCLGKAEGEYGSTSSRGRVVAWEWRVNGDTAGVSQSQSIHHVFRDRGEAVVTLTVFDDEGRSDTDTVTTTVLGPANPIECIAGAFVDGRFALRIPPGGGSTVATCAVRGLEAVESVDSVVWTVQDSTEPSGDGISVGVGPTVDVTLEPGTYAVQATVFAAGTTQILARGVTVVEREPFLEEPGWIAVQLVADSDDAGIWYLDAETGVWDGPYLTSEFIYDLWGCEPRGNRVLYTRYDEGFESNDVWIANRYGGHQRPLVVTPGNSESADWGSQGWIAYMDDSNGDFQPYLVRPDGSGRWSLYGRSPAQDPVGFRVAVSPSADHAAVGGVPTGVENQRSLAIYDLTSEQPALTMLRTESAMHLYGEDVWSLWEGINGLTFSPDGEWIAFQSVSTTPGYVNHSHLARIRTDRTGFEILDSGGEGEVAYQPVYSPDGGFLLYDRNLDGIRRVMILDLADGSIRRVDQNWEAEGFVVPRGWCRY